MIKKYSVLRSMVYAVFILIASLSTSITLAEEAPENWLEQASTTIKQQEKILLRLTPNNTDVEAFNISLKEITQIKGKAQSCITDTESLILKTTLDIETLGELTKTENPEVTKKRQSLSAEHKSLDQQLATCKLLLIQTQDLASSINEIQQRYFAEQLSAQTPHIIQVIKENLNSPTAGWQNAVSFLNSQYQLKLLTTGQLGLLGILIALSIIIGLTVARSQRLTTAPVREPSDTFSAFTLALRTSLIKALPMLLPVVVMAIFLSLASSVKPLPFITKASYAFVIYISLIVFINTLLCPAPPAKVYLNMLERPSRQYAWHLKVLLTLGLIGYFLLTGEFKASLNDSVYLFNRSIFSTLLIINLISILWLVRNFSWTILSYNPRIVLSLVLVATLVAELSGYRNLSFFVLGGLLGTATSLAIMMLIYRLLKDLCDGLDSGRLDWQIRLRDAMGLKHDQLIPGLIWARLIIFGVLWGSFAIAALYAWRLDDPWLIVVTGYITEGFQIGSLNVIPTQLASGVVALILLISLTRYTKIHILPNLLKYTRLDRGVKEAVTSLTGYAGAAIALLVALSISGVQMENIALIAGALSVGIGFGLQNIVSNFISGLILLFERPIRRGDWIVAGDTEGYVKSINIRSTQIKTFDQSDVIVPNSELITAKVTNWMLTDAHGRITIPIGVSYDSDVEKVHRILLKLAQDHPLVMKETNLQTSPPKVLFRSFGDSALNFELRCFIYDIDQRLNVISELNFAILKTFREEHIEIPFPQRVLTYSRLHDEGSANK